MEQNPSSDRTAPACCHESTKSEFGDTEDFFRTYFDHSLVGMAITSPQKGWLRVNPALCNMLGRSFDELQHTTWADLTHPDDLPADVAQFEQLLAGEIDSYSMEKRFLHRNGHAIPTILSVACVREAQGEVAYVLAQLQDLTAQKQAQTQLRQKEKERDAALQSLSKRIKVMDCLSQISNLTDKTGMNSDKLLRESASLLRTAFQDPENTSVRIEWNGSAYSSGNGKDAPANGFAPIHAGNGPKGAIAVWFAGSAPTEEDRSVVDAVAENLGRTIERIDAAEELKQSEAKYRRLHETMTEAYVMVDMTGKIIDHNPIFREMLGYTDQELPNLTYVDMTPERWHAFEAEIVANEILPNGRSRVYEKEYIRRDGTVFPVELRTFLIRDDHGAPSAMWAIVRDISARKQKQTELLESKRIIEVRSRIAEVFLTATGDDLFHALLETILDATASKYGVLGYIDEKGDLVVPTMTRKVWDNCQVAGKDTVFPRDQWGDSIWPSAIRKKELLYSNVRSKRTPTGHIAIERNLAAPIVNRGEVIGLLQVANKETDYTDHDIEITNTIVQTIAPFLDAFLTRRREERYRKKVLETTLQERIQLLAILDGIDDVIYVADPQTHELLHVNEAFKASWGKDVIGQLCYQVLQNRESPCPFCTNEKILREYLGRSYVWEFQNEITKNWYRCSDKAIQWVDGRTVRFEIAADITQLKKLEAELQQNNEKLERSNKELEMFAYVASHDLQEPLRMVASYTELLAERYKGKLDQKADKFIAYAVDGAKRMQRLINDLLLLSRVNTRGKPFTPVDCNKLVEKVLLDMGTSIQEAQAEIQVDHLPEVMGDDTQLLQLFQNLIANAIKFHGAERPRVKISAEQKDREWVFAVQDNGIGIEPQFFERIFVIFQRLNERGAYKGSGIGLSIAKKIVERHNGKLWVDSTPGKGTTFCFTLPQANGNEETCT